MTDRLNQTRQQPRPKSSSSKYDFVKVRVHLPNDHYYVLSRFLLSRMLTASRVNYGHAIRIALDLKKRLVEKSKLDVSQDDLQKELFDLFHEYGYGREHVRWYKTVVNFHHHRIPLVVLIGGTGSTGKSTIATALSERLNLSSVLKTDVICDVMYTYHYGTLPPNLWHTPDIDSLEETVSRYSEIVCKGLDGDLYKSVTDGKSVIIEGALVNHDLLNHLYQFIRQQQKQTVVVAPFILTVKDKEAHHRMLRETMSPDTQHTAAFERARQFQEILVQRNELSMAQNTPYFHTVSMDTEDLQSVIDTIQSRVLELIAHQVHDNS